MTLEDQLHALANLGLTLNDGVTVDDLLYSFDREEYENEPFDLLLFVLGSEVEREPWGRSICSRVWNFDTECISETGDYVSIVKRICEVAGNPDLVTQLEDSVDLESGKAWLKYQIDGSERFWDVEVNADWADTLVISYVMHDIERAGSRFYFKDNGQSMILFYLDESTARELNNLTAGALKPVLAE